jgi:hypothetical protein
MKSWVIVAIAMALGSSAWAGDFNANSGSYAEGNSESIQRYSPDYNKPGFRFLKSGTKIRVIEIKNNIVYGFDYADEVTPKI